MTAVAPIDTAERSAKASLPLGPNVTHAYTLGVKVHDSISYEEWGEAVAQVASVADSSVWALGDLLAYGEWNYGEKYTLLVDRLELRLDRVRDWVYVSRHVPHPVRRRSLSWSHHRVVAKLVPAEQESWLAKAEEERWSYRELSDALTRALANPQTLASAVMDQVRFTVAADRSQEWREAAERSGKSFQQWCAEGLDAFARAA